MADLTATDFADLIANRIRSEHVALAARWLERLRDLLDVASNEVFPTEHLLDHIPALIEHVADYVRAPKAEAAVADTLIMSKAQELGELRHSQKASVHQLLGEYRLLGSILIHFVQEELERLAVAPAPADAIEVVRRINEAIWILMQTTVNTFISEYTGTIASHAGRLESFNRMVSHELRQPLATLMYAVPLLKGKTFTVDPARSEHLVSIVERNVTRLVQQMDQLETVSRLRSGSSDTPTVQSINIATLAWDVARQLREMAEARGVDLQVADDLPELVIDRARLELLLTNLMSNAIKYSDPEKAVRWVRIEHSAPADAKTVSLAVRDNGIGIPGESLATVFQRFVRAHASRDAELGVRGSGLGLAIAAECAEEMGAAIRVESSPGVGTTFFIDLPQHASDSSGSAEGAEAP